MSDPLRHRIHRFLNLSNAVTPTEEVLADLDRAAFDPAFIMSLKSRLIDTGLWERLGCPVQRSKSNQPPPMAPTKSDITAIRAGLWDNWPMGQRTKAHPNRYGVSIEIWDLPAEDIEAVKARSLNFKFKSNFSLMDRKALKGQVRHLRKPRINPMSNVDRDYLDALLGIDDPRFLIGMLNSNIKTDDSEHHRGVYYHPFQFVVIEMSEGKVTSGRLYDGEQFIDLAPFVNHDCNGEPLKGIVQQSRLDLVGFDKSWGS